MWLLSLEARLASGALTFAAARLRAALAKANFDPNQPRVPRGNSDGGRWTRVGEEVPSDDVQVVRDDPPPDIPPTRPPRGRDRNRVIKELARWARFFARRNPVVQAITIVQTVAWLHEGAPFIIAYLDGPKSLEELGEAVSEPRRGYDIHHIVEQTPARNDGFDNALINAPENLVRIPTLKHWEINSWFMTPNKAYGGLSPRAFLRGKSWDARYRVGLEALQRAGVLAP